MKILSKKEYNTNNAWGFGGVAGIEYTFENGLTLVEGQAYYRHLNPEPAFLLRLNGERIHEEGRLVTSEGLTIKLQKFLNRTFRRNEDIVIVCVENGLYSVSKLIAIENNFEILL